MVLLVRRWRRWQSGEGKGRCYRRRRPSPPAARRTPVSKSTVPTRQAAVLLSVLWTGREGWRGLSDRSRDQLVHQSTGQWGFGVCLGYLRWCRHAWRDISHSTSCARTASGSCTPCLITCGHRNGTLPPHTHTHAHTLSHTHTHTHTHTHARAHSHTQKWSRAEQPSISAAPQDNNKFVWNVTIMGDLDGGWYENGIYHLTLTFAPDFPEVLPRPKFATKHVSSTDLRK